MDSVVKLRSREAQGGVNIEIRLLEQKGKEMHEIANSTQRGIYEVFGYSSLQRGTRYQFVLRFHNSLIQLSTDQSCPNYHLEFSMMSKEEAQRIDKEHTKITDSENYKSESKLTDIFNEIERVPAMQSYFFKHPETIFTQ